MGQEKYSIFAGTTLSIILVAILFSCSAIATELTTQVNIVLADGTIMIYAGTDAGINVGDEFEVRRGGEIVGHIKAIKTKNLFTYAELLDGDAKEMDQVMRTELGAPAAIAPEVKAPETKEKTVAPVEPVSKEKAPAEEAPVAEEKKKKPERVKKTRSSSRREKAKDATQETDDTPKTDKKDEKDKPKSRARKTPKETPKKKDKKERAAGKVFPEPKKKHHTQYPPIGGVRATGFGLTGLFFMPTANTIPDRRGNIHFVYADANDDWLGYTHTGIGLGYGLNGNMEVAYTHLNTSYDVPTGYISMGDARVHVLSFKYQLKTTRMPTLALGATGEARFAAGFQYFSSDSDDNNATASLQSNSMDATRLYAVTSGNLSTGTGHAGIYYQSGSMVDDTYDDGFGWMAGLEYPLGNRMRTAAGSTFTDNMSVIFEYDSKAFYLGTAKTPNLGLRYNFRSRGHATLGILDLSEASIMVLEGAYDY